MRSHPNPASMEGLGVEHCAFQVAQQAIYAAWLALRFKEAWNSRPQLRQAIRKHARPEVEVLSWMMNIHDNTPKLEKLLDMLKAVVSQFRFWNHERRLRTREELPKFKHAKGHVVLNRMCVDCCLDVDPARPCAVCDGGLAVCALCGQAEIGLEETQCTGSLDIHKARIEMKRLASSKATRKELLVFVRRLEASDLISSRGCDRIQELLMEDVAFTAMALKLLPGLL